MAITYKLTVGKVSGGNFQPDNAYTDLNLRKSPYTTRESTQTAGAITDGLYEFLNVSDGDYKVYDGNTEQTNMGIIPIGEDQAVTITGNQTVAGTKTFSSQIVVSHADGIKLDKIQEYTAAAGVTIDGVLIKDSLDASNIVSKTGSQDISGAKTITTSLNIDSGGAIFNIESGGIGIIEDAPTIGSHIVNKTYADSLAITPFQQSANVVRLIVNGVQETNKVYTNYATALYNAWSFADSTRRMTIMVEGMGTGAATIAITDAGGGAGFINDYITVRGISQQQTRLTVPDDTLTVTTLGNSSFENLTMILTGGAADPIFEKLVFNNVFFDLDVNSVTFTNCEFRNCTVKITTGSPTYTSCKGSGVYTTGSFGSSPINGTDSISVSDIA